MSTIISRANISPRMTDYRGVFVSAATDALWFLRELEKLLILEDYNGFTLQPSPRAGRNARQYLTNASYKISLPEAEFTPDGDGGIDIEWEYNGRRLALSCRATLDSSDFISWREVGKEYDGREASQELLDERLKWLIS